MKNENTKSRVLVVDDDSALRRLFRFILEREGYEVAELASGEQMLTQAADARPDLILLDVNRPEANGLEICRQLKDDQRTRQVPVIIVTARAPVGTRAESLRAGAVDSISKPFSPYMLRARIQAAMQPHAA